MSSASLLFQPRGEGSFSAATDEKMIAAASREAPDLILAPMLKIAVPEEVWSRHLCLIVHPGIKGDRCPSSLDWAITNDEKVWA